MEGIRSDGGKHINIANLLGSNRHLFKDHRCRFGSRVRFLHIQRPHTPYAVTAGSTFIGYGSVRLRSTLANRFVKG